ncbi:hypothetical protein TCAL_14068 [Tigriopus californicus]|uniref:RRM domain-containing protein n=1 Tax=Tigriopus californicus TaxID=6832 RepID=A0A553N7F3_TIGCA|nr:uncharacterized protein LOC131885366 [Tigriopus californicus]TRY61372.1 hypothetical protein TCAL_14068 [Tigriopus californicus]|eukprot:TCALIF_14068-PA protein Name:"Similar to HNRNP Heterogeneous nuclear ribonucleoprotein A1, A2/B1 homolog (Schistocerca americana)" AED:0.22 eAED:0.22 QI:0/0/0/0.5/1/1/2/0/503
MSETRPPTLKAGRGWDAAQAAVNRKRSAIRNVTASSDWSWEDEMLMYDVCHRDTKKAARRHHHAHHPEEATPHAAAAAAAAERKRLQKEKHLETLYAQECRKLFVGGLSKDTVEKDLRKHFTPFGHLLDVRVMRDRERGTSRGFGFVTFACSFMAEAAMNEPASEHVINDQRIELKLAKPNAPRFKQTLPQLAAQLEDECQNKRSIFVGALKDTITEEDLVEYFSVFGKVIRAIKHTDRASGTKKTFGFVDFAEFGVVRQVMNCTKHFIQGQRIRVELSRPRIEFSHQTKTVFVGGLEDGIDDPELTKYFSEFGFVTRALRIPNKDEPKRKYGFVDFDAYDAVDIVVSQREHYINGHRVRVELALPMINDSLYEKDIVAPTETWLEKVQRKLQYAVPDQGTWGETLNNYEIFVQSGSDVTTVQFKLQRGLLEYVVGMGGKVVEEIANDSNTRIVLDKPKLGAKHVVFSITGQKTDVSCAQYIFQQIVKSNVDKLNTVRPITNS